MTAPWQRRGGSVVPRQILELIDDTAPCRAGICECRPRPAGMDWAWQSGDPTVDFPAVDPRWCVVTATRHLTPVPTLAEVIPLPQHGVERTPLARHVLQATAEGRIARSSALGGWRITVSGSPASGAVAAQLDTFTAAGLVEWRYFDPGGDIALATLRGAQTLIEWGGAHGPGDAA